MVVILQCVALNIIVATENYFAEMRNLALALKISLKFRKASTLSETPRGSYEENTCKKLNSLSLPDEGGRDDNHQLLRSFCLFLKILMGLHKYNIEVLLI